MSCDHILTDSRIFLHIFDEAYKPHYNIYIRVLDSDIVVVAVSRLRLTEWWVGFGSDKTLQPIPSHDILENIGLQWCVSFPLLFSGWLRY